MKGRFSRKLAQGSEEAVKRGRESRDMAGTVVSVDVATMTAQVLFQDGSANPMPALIAGHVVCQENDRVVLNKYGPRWVIMGTTGVVRGLGAGSFSQAATGASAPVGSWGNLPGTPAFTFVKRWNTTRALWLINTSLFGTNAVTYQFGITYNAGSTTVKLGDARFANTGGSGTVYDCQFTHCAIESNLPAGTYTVRGRWQADGAATTTADDWFSGLGLEVP